MGGDDIDKKPLVRDHHYHANTLLRSLIAWSFFIIPLCYLLYSSNTNLLFSSSRADDLNTTLSLSNSSSVEQEDITPPSSPPPHETTVVLEKEQEQEEIAEEGADQSQEEENEQDTGLQHIVFCIAASSGLWEKRKEYIKQWWRPGETRGVVWLDKQVLTHKGEGLPEFHISGSTTRLPYKHPTGLRSALRISRVVSETLRMKPENVRWFVMGDDDTVFIIENVIRVLQKYDHREFYYIGSPSESHLQNLFFSYGMAYGGGGFAISYPLAVELERMQDACIKRYAHLYGSDDRIQACMAELGVPLTREPGFHQYDVYGDLLGLLAAHPVAPLVSLHHLDVVQPIFPGTTPVKAIEHLLQIVSFDSSSIMQQSICYDKKQWWSVSVSWGFVVQIYRGRFSPRELETPARTFLNWYKRGDYFAYAFNTRPVARHPCQKPFTYYVKSVRFDKARNETVSVHERNKGKSPSCRWKSPSPESIDTVVVYKRPDPLRWKRSPRRDCCRVLSSNKKSTMYISVGHCREGEFSEL